ncbi:RepB family plasmid replication initiator protein [Salmonella enterica]|uniref:replication initiation protein n=1 Tax=Escherichia coli TaxID=562 RepID=UPI001279B6AC|nr:replication initiation protein [Escherichia coli]EAR0142757.1 RepB family plasmid replication initiator protein [Salmonella enterica]EBH1896204.1 replication initiation protein [Salmonella enterica]EBI3260749.1 replication initiation protein [Salmonella enterica]ECH5480029.1 replication initiation protein [Salmonella enterica]ECM6624754.1 replication initiation protein [Salmonella enterica]
MSELIACKSNALTEASYKLSLQEQRFLLVCVSRIDSRVGAPPPEKQKTVTVTAAEFHEAFPDMGRQHAEAKLKEAIDRLWDRSIIIKNEEKREEFRWVQYRAQYFKGEAKVEITFSDAIMPYLTQLKGQFTKVVVKNVSSLSSTYSIRIYELLQQFRSTGDRTISIEDFRAMLGLDGKYKTFKSLNQLLITPAIAELNEKSDLAVTVETVKKGRTVVALRFRFKEDKQIKMAV